MLHAYLRVVGACLLTYWSTSYWELYLCRAVTGFSIGGALPLIYSILGDLFTADERHKVNAGVGIGTGLGTSVGQGIAGFLGPTFGWRLPFLVVSLPALVCAALVWKTVADPERGQLESAVLEHRRKTINNISTRDDEESFRFSDTSEETQTSVEMQQLKLVASEDETLTGDHNQHLNETASLSIIQGRSKLGVRRRSRSLERDNSQTDEGCTKESPRVATAKLHTFQIFYRQHVEPVARALLVLLKTPTVLLALLQGAPGCIPWGIVLTYLNDFLAEDRGMSVEFATFTVLWFGFGNFVGQLAGGAGGQYLYCVDKRYPALLAGSMAIFGCVPFWILLNQVNSTSSFLYLASVSFVSGAAAGVTGPIIKATLQNVTLPTMRGQAFALFNTFDDFGRGLGPVFVAFLITRMGILQV